MADEKNLVLILEQNTSFQLLINLQTVIAGSLSNWLYNKSEVFWHSLYSQFAFTPQKCFQKEKGSI